MRQDTKPGAPLFAPVTVTPPRDLVPAVASQAFVPTATHTKPAKFTPDQQRKIADLQKELQNPNCDLTQYGARSCAQMDTYADRLLNTVSATNLGDFTQPLEHIITLCKTVNADSLINNKSSRWPWVNWWKRRTVPAQVRAMTYFNSVKGQIDDAVAELMKRVDVQRQVVAQLEDLYALNMAEYQDFVCHIEAAESVYRQRANEYNEFVANHKDAMATDPLLAQQASDMNRYLLRLERRIDVLKNVQMSCIQTAPQYRREQDSAEMAIEKIGNLRALGIPMWKKMAAAYVSSIETKKSLDMVSAADTATNEMYKRGMQAVNANALASAKLIEQSVLNVDTLQQCNDELIQSIRDCMAVGNQARADRQQAEVARANMKKALYENVVVPQSQFKPIAIGDQQNG